MTQAHKMSHGTLDDKEKQYFNTLEKVLVKCTAGDEKPCLEQLGPGSCCLKTLMLELPSAEKLSITDK